MLACEGAIKCKPIGDLPVKKHEMGSKASYLRVHTIKETNNDKKQNRMRAENKKKGDETKRETGMKQIRGEGNVDGVKRLVKYG